jgi:hypothetical protein
LVERLLCKQDVNGSSPLISICEKQKKKRNNSAPVKGSLLDLLRNRSRKHLENCIYTKRSQVETS